MKTLMTDGSLALVTDASGEAWVFDTETGAQSIALSADERAGVLAESIDMADVEMTPAEVEVLNVEAEESDDVDEGAAYWVTATVNGLTVRLYAAPPADGRPGLEPCGSGVQDW